MLPMLFLSGAMFPLRGVPAWMELLSKIDPVTYGVDPLRQVVLSGSVPDAVLDNLILNPIAVNVTVLAILGVVFIIPAVWLFSKQD